MKSEISVAEIQMGELLIECETIVDESYLTTNDAKKIVSAGSKMMFKCEELRKSRDKAITRRDKAEAELKQIIQPVKEKPMKCKCGKMVRRPAGNKSGMCSACSMRERNRLRMIKKRKTAGINNASLGGEE